MGTHTIVSVASVGNVVGRVCLGGSGCSVDQKQGLGETDRRESVPDEVTGATKRSGRETGQCVTLLLEAPGPLFNRTLGDGKAEAGKSSCEVSAGSLSIPIRVPQGLMQLGHKDDDGAKRLRDGDPLREGGSGPWTGQHGMETWMVPPCTSQGSRPIGDPSAVIRDF